MPRSPTLAVLLALLAAACPGRPTPEAPGTDASEAAPAPDDAPNLRIELTDAPGTASPADARTAAVHTPPRLVEAWPRWISARDPVLVLHFDQRIDAAAVLPALHVEVEGGAPPLRLATLAERAGPDVRAQLSGLDPARTATFAFTTPLPLRVGVEVWMSDVPTFDGRLRSHDRDSFSFSVHDRLRVVGIGCSSGPVCRPGAAIVLRFSAHLRPSPGLQQRIRVHPPLDGAVEVSETDVYLNGATRAHQTYEVTLPADFEDTYGQVLGQTSTLRVHVAGPEPSFDISGGTAITLLAPDQPRALVARTINVARLQVVVHAVRPADWPAHVATMAPDDGWQARAAARFGPPVLSYMVPVTGTKDQVARTTIDLGAALPRGLGHAVVEVRPVDWPDAEVPRFRTWLQATQIGLDAVVDATTVLAWTTDLQTGAALPGVRVQLGAAAAHSDADGLARLPLPTTRTPVLTATRGQDVAMLADDGEGFVRTVPAPLLLPVVVTDRGVYGPGETVRVKGWLRRHTRGPLGELAPVDARALTYTLVDPAGRERGAGQLELTRHDSFDFTVTLPPLIDPGSARLAFSAGDEHFVHALQIAGRPQPTLRVRSDAGPHIVGGHAELTASVRASAGDAPITALQWTVHQTPAHFTPPSHEDFEFGRRRETHDTPPAVHHTSTDARGEHTLRARFTALTFREPTAVIAGATVTAGSGVLDLAPATVTLLVHPASLYVGLRSAGRFVEAGAPLIVDAVVTDLGGKRVSGRPIVLRAHARTADGKPGRSIGECRLRSAHEPVRCALQPQGAGEYSFTATVVDEQGRAQDSELTLWAAGEPSTRPADPALRVIPDHDQHRVGATARVLVLAPFTPAEGLWTLRRDGVRRSGRFHMRGVSTVLDIPIDEAMAPGAVLHVQLVGRQPHPTNSPRPAHAEGEARLTVSPSGRNLDLSFEPAPAQQRLTVTVRGADGRPVVGAEVTAFIVEEAAHVLTDLFADYPPDLGTGTTDHRNRHNLVGTHGPPASAYPFAPLPRGVPVSSVRDDAVGIRLAGSHPASRVRLRGTPRSHSDLDSPVVFTSAAPTDVAGRAHVAFTLPHGRTHHRVLAYATAGTDRFGAAQTILTVTPVPRDP